MASALLEHKTEWPEIEPQPQGGGFFNKDSMEVEDEEIKVSDIQQLALVTRATRHVHIPFNRFVVLRDTFLWETECGMMIVEEPQSPGQDDSDDESKLDSSNFEAEAFKILSKRKTEAETVAEKRARLTHDYYRRQGYNLGEVIDEVAANHEELHEKATTIRLKMEEEQEDIQSRARTRVMGSDHRKRESDFIYEDELSDYDAPPGGGDTHGQQPSPQSFSSSPKKAKILLKKFISPTTKANKDHVHK